MIIYTSDDDEKLKKLTQLKSGDLIYTLEIQHDGNKESTEVKIRKFTFVTYEYNKPDKKVESLDSFEPLIATIRDPKYPKVDIKHQDISSGYFLSPIEAVEASIELFENLLKLLKEKLCDLNNQL